MYVSVNTFRHMYMEYMLNVGMAVIDLTTCSISIQGMWVDTTSHEGGAERRPGGGGAAG